VQHIFRIEVEMAPRRVMLTFPAGKWRFTFRVGAIVIRRGHVLLMRSIADDIWFTPGGRVEAGEAARDALAREVREELCVAGRIERLLWTNENFFKHRGVAHHELGLYFNVVLPDGAHRDLSATFISKEDDGARFLCAWHRIAWLSRINLQPAFLIDSLAQLPRTAQHILNDEIAMGRPKARARRRG
jgi:ADP-ribose pyrophosphatase YjhB (NUDIX family)